MAADNTQLNTNATAGDTVRDLARLGGSVKTQVVQLDLGGASANAEILITAGQQTMTNSVPVVIASDQAGSQRTPTITTSTTSGTVAAGSRKSTFIFSSNFTGTVLGATFAGVNDSALTIDAPHRDTLSAIAYTVTAGSVRIVTVT